VKERKVPTSGTFVEAIEFEVPVPRRLNLLVDDAINTSLGGSRRSRTRPDQTGGRTSLFKD
jgi:hypothetical protein